MWALAQFHKHPPYRSLDNQCCVKVRCAISAVFVCLSSLCFAKRFWVQTHVIRLDFTGGFPDRQLNIERGVVQTTGHVYFPLMTRAHHSVRITTSRQWVGLTRWQLWPVSGNHTALCHWAIAHSWQDELSRDQLLARVCPANRDVRFGLNLGQIDLRWDKFRTF